MAPESYAEATVTVKTTLPARPLPPLASRPIIKTERLVIRALSQDDLPGYHALRSEPEVMAFTSLGRVDVDLAESQKRLDAFLPPNDADTSNVAVLLAATGELIGVGGVHRFARDAAGGWPEFGYMFSRAHWGRGYATEFARAFLPWWWSLPRENVEIQVEPLSAGLVGDENTTPGVEVIEQLCAVVEVHNAGSLRIMDKMGFQKYKVWSTQDSRAGFEDCFVELAVFVLGRPPS
ncbi:GNAT domain-containing protein [Xylariales sp. PMI_506]|nr:GNAT domain-containing protein [Xylariales sp. PMI_506]